MKLIVTTTMAERPSTSRPSQKRHRQMPQQYKRRRGRMSREELPIKMKYQLRILQVNVEGYSKAKGDILSKMMHIEKIDVLAIQETHLDERSIHKLNIPGYEIVTSMGHEKFGTATLVRQELLDKVTEIMDPSIHCIGMKIGGTTIYNVYKPPSQEWEPHVLPKAEHPAIYVGDFNSHHTRWGYHSPDKHGERLGDWADINSFHLVYDGKDRATFTSRVWRTSTTPDLCFVSTESSGRVLPVQRTVLSRFPKSQHRPTVISVGLQIPILISPPIPRWNMRKAQWTEYKEYIEKVVPRIPPIPANYYRFLRLVIKSAHKSIPRGARKAFIPGWSEECQRLLYRYNELEEPETAEALTSLLDEERRQRWHELVESLDFSHSSRKTWNLLRKLGGAHLPQKNASKMNPVKISASLARRARISVSKRQRMKIQALMRDAEKNCSENTQLSEQISVEEVNKGILQMQQGKAAGPDDIPPEFLKNLGLRGIKWLADLFTNILETSMVPEIWKEARIIAILKPGKEGNETADYRPISLLCTTYKLFERILLTRLGPILDKEIPMEQAGFRANRSCCDQVLSLTTFIENGFQNRNKTGVVLLDLSAAYDTVWLDGLFFKLTRTIKCLKITRLLKNMLSGRKFRVISQGKACQPRFLRNGLPQGSVMSPCLFNLYIADLPELKAKKFAYADDLAVALQRKTFEQLEKDLNPDLTRLQHYYRRWHLLANPHKTVCTVMHLNNKEAKREMKLKFCGRNIKHERAPKYLGVKLDRSLTYREHLVATSQKMKTRNNLISKLAGTSWGSSAATLRTSALALVYSVAEYCAPVWKNSVHAKKVDVQLNEAMRLISGTLKAAPVHWLPVLTNIQPPYIRREQAASKERSKIEANPKLPIHEYVYGNNRLKSRRPFCMNPRDLYDSSGEWKRIWKETKVRNWTLIDDPTKRVPGFNLKRRQWTTLNRLRTGFGRCKEQLRKWGYSEDGECECGLPQTMDHIIQCPIYGFENGNLESLHNLSDAGAEWLRDLKVCL